MTTLVITPAKANVSATIDSRQVTVSNMKAVCYNNTVAGLESWDGVSQAKAQERVRKATYAFAERLQAGETLEFFMNVQSLSTSELTHAVVYKATSEFNGTCTDSWMEGLKEVGVLVKQGRSWTVETDLEAIELMRREIQLEKCRTGDVKFGNFTKHDDNNLNALDMAAYFDELDAKNGGEVQTRGYHIH